MGYKKLIKRDEISGLHQHVDVADGEYGAQELARRADARQAALLKAVQNDWPDSMTSSTPESHPTLGNALARSPKPSDVVAGSANHYGVGNEKPSKKGGEVANGPKTSGRG